MAKKNQQIILWERNQTLLVRLYVFVNVELNSLNVERLFHNKNKYIYLYYYLIEYLNIVIYLLLFDDVANYQMDYDYDYYDYYYLLMLLLLLLLMMVEDRK
jgi:hypothetical protein